MSVRQMMMGRKPAAGGGEPFPLNGDVDWAHALWAEGSEFEALGYAADASVTNWPDEVGTDDFDEYGNGAPLYRTSVAALNNKPALQGSGWGGLRGNWTSTVQPYTIVIIGNFGAAGNGEVMFEGYGSTVPTYFAYLGNWIQAGGTEVTGGTSPGTSSHLFVVTFNGASSSLEIDGATVISGNPGSGSCGGLTIFSNRNFGPGSHTGRVAFLGIKEGTLTAQELSDIEAWASSHYGLTIS